MLESVVAAAETPSVEWSNETTEELLSFANDTQLTDVDSSDAFFGWFAGNGGSYELVANAWGQTEDESNPAVTLDKILEENGTDSPLGLILSALEPQE